MKRPPYPPPPVSRIRRIDDYLRFAFPGAQLGVQEEQRVAGIAGQLQHVHDFLSVGLFLHLLIHKPFQEAVCRVILFGERPGPPGYRCWP